MDILKNKDFHIGLVELQMKLLAVYPDMETNICFGDNYLTQSDPYCVGWDSSKIVLAIKVRRGKNHYYAKKIISFAMLEDPLKDPKYWDCMFQDFLVQLSTAIVYG